MKLFIFLLVIPLILHAKIKVAITIDDLPLHLQIPTSTHRFEIAKKMMVALKKHKVPEVYGFLNAERLEKNQKLIEILNHWISYGYPLGNHTYSHKSLNEISVEEFKKEIDKNELALKKLSGKSDWKYFRYPYLCEGNNVEKRNAIRSYLKEKGYQIAQVTIDFEDWSWNEPYARCSNKVNLEEINWLKQTFLQNATDQLHRAEKLSQALFNRPISHILLLHIGAFDAEIMDELLTQYKKEDVEFIPLSEAIKDEIYLIDPGYTFNWGSEFTYQIMKSRGLSAKDLGLEPYTNYPKEKLTTVCN